MSRTNLDTGNRLMLVQGISLIENGLQFLEWMTNIANENSLDALNILQDRFQYFKDCALSDGECDYFLMDKAKGNLKNIQYGFKLNQKTQNELVELRKIVCKEQKEED